jgi:hypothetical protein
MWIVTLAIGCTTTLNQHTDRSYTRDNEYQIPLASYISTQHVLPDSNYAVNNLHTQDITEEPLSEILLIPRPIPTATGTYVSLASVSPVQEAIPTIADAYVPLASVAPTQRNTPPPEIDTSVPLGSTTSSQQSTPPEMAKDSQAVSTAVNSYSRATFSRRRPHQDRNTLFHSFMDYESSYRMNGVLVPQRVYSVPRDQAATFQPLPPILFSVNGTLGFPLGDALQFPIRGVLDKADTVPLISQRADRVQLRMKVRFFHLYC